MGGGVVHTLLETMRREGGCKNAFNGNAWNATTTTTTTTTTSNNKHNCSRQMRAYGFHNMVVCVALGRFDVSVAQLQTCGARA
jgi:hypothetical protein